MNKIFQMHITAMDYDRVNERAEIITLGGKPESIAMIYFAKQNKSAWDSLRCFWLKNFSWNWIKVNDGAQDSTRLINMHSITKHLGIKTSEIRKSNKNGKLYQTICTRNELLNPEAIVQYKMNEFKKNEIKNFLELKTMRRTISYLQDREEVEFFIFFDPSTKAIQVSHERHNGHPNGLGRSYKNTSEILHSFEIQATVYKEDGKCYLKIDRIYFPAKAMKARDEELDGTQADLLRQEVLDIYKKP